MCAIKAAMKGRGGRETFPKVQRGSEGEKQKQYSQKILVYINNDLG